MRLFSRAVADDCWIAPRWWTVYAGCRHGKARSGWLGRARCGVAGGVRQGRTGHDKARQGRAGMVGHGGIWPGVARPGMAGKIKHGSKWAVLFCALSKSIRPQHRCPGHGGRCTGLRSPFDGDQSPPWSDTATPRLRFLRSSRTAGASGCTSLRNR